MAANVETMFIVREKPWHGLGTRVEVAPTSADALKMAGLDWEVLQESIYTDAGDKIEIINQYETEEFKYYINLRRQWVTEGLVQPEVEDTRVLPGINDESVVIPALIRVNVYKPGVESDLFNTHKYMPVPLVRTTGYLTSGGIVATMNGISSTSKNPELALKVLEAVNTDPEIHNAISFGIEGVNYTKTGENRITLEGAQQKYTMADWAVGCVFNSYILPEQEDDVWTRTKEINDIAKRSPLLGFNPNMDNLKTQIAACNSAVDEFLKVLDYGVVDVETTYAEFINKLNAAGAAEIIKDVQAQVDEWLKVKNG